MEAMHYEYLLRRVYNCGRHGVDGADADYYRSMEFAEAVLDDPNWGKSKQDKEYEFRKAFAGIKMYVVKALRDGLKKVQYRVTKKETEKLETMQSEVSSIGFYNKKRLNEIIDDADEIFRKHGLEIG
jgi:hypothetical protein